MLLTCITCGIWIYDCHQDFAIPKNYSHSVQIVIPQQTSLETISKLLFENNVIDSPFKFKWIVRLKGFAPHIKAGEYLFPANRSMQSVMKQLVNGKTVQRLITIPEGLTSRQSIDIINNAPFLNDKIYELPAEGTLLPETYSYSYGESRLLVLNRMQTARQKILDQVWHNRSPECFLKTLDEAITLASIVEKETALQIERPNIAAVFINRLKYKMPLQSDPTVIYALEQILQHTLNRDLIRADLKILHPYNTYLIPALPPGPICNPSLEAIKAVLRPAVTDDLYFVADGTGGHIFARTLNEHQRNHHHWRLIRKALIIKQSPKTK